MPDSPADQPPQHLPTSILPPTGELERLANISPHLLASVMEEWARQMEHQRRMERAGMRNARIVAMMGLFVALISVVVSAFYQFTPGALAGGAVGTVDLVALVTVFLSGRRG